MKLKLVLLMTLFFSSTQVYAAEDRVEEIKIFRQCIQSKNSDRHDPCVKLGELCGEQNGFACFMGALLFKDSEDSGEFDKFITLACQYGSQEGCLGLEVSKIESSQCENCQEILKEKADAIIQLLTPDVLKVNESEKAEGGK